ncbi:MAG: hypothetical protein LBP28_03730 [Coriobacteriales bacterium]|jgi:hypothetical protein|nr:hypothetical protein [Coriobacteriales bacterium]
MSVELAVCLPVILAVVAIMVNVMGYLEACARFDRVAAEAVRIEATSPGYGAYGTALRAQRVNDLIAASFAERNEISVEVSGAPGAGADSSAGSDGAGGSSGAGGAGGGTFSMLTRLETYRCTLHYRPLGFGGEFFGLRFFDLSHTNAYTVDPFRPGVIA